MPSVVYITDCGKPAAPEWDRRLPSTTRPHRRDVFAEDLYLLIVPAAFEESLLFVHRMNNAVGCS